MKGLYLVLLLAGNLFSQTTTEAVIADSMVTDGDHSITPLFIDDLGWIDITVDVTTTHAIEIDLTTMDFQDCKGDDLMFNYVSGQIQEIDLTSFGDRQASYYLIQAPEALKAYQWMRKNRGHKYTIHQMVVRVNEWYRGKWHVEVNE